MFRKIVVLTGALLFGGANYIHATLQEGNPQRPDMVGWGAYGSSRPAVGIDADGDILPSHNRQFDVGEDTHRFKTAYLEAVNTSSPIAVITDTFVELSSGNLTGARSVGFGVSTRTLAEGPTTFFNWAINQPTGAPRNVTIYVTSSPHNVNIGGGITTTTMIMSATFYGINSKGEFTWEHIYGSTRAVQWSTATVANSSDITRYRGVGNVPFAYISSFTIEVTSMSDTFGLSTSSPIIRVGYGQKIGLSANVTKSTTGVNGDVFMITEDGGLNTADQNSYPNVTVDPTYDWIVFNTPPNGINDKKTWSKHYGP